MWNNSLNQKKEILLDYMYFVEKSSILRETEKQYFHVDEQHVLPFQNHTKHHRAKITQRQIQTKNLIFGKQNLNFSCWEKSFFRQSPQKFQSFQNGYQTQCAGESHILQNIVILKNMRGKCGKTHKLSFSRPQWGQTHFYREKFASN